jgi:8-oxo-dGTP diphosphatase
MRKKSEPLHNETGSSVIDPKIQKSQPGYPTHPKVAVGAVVIHNSCALLVKRRNPPSAGMWAIPGGSVELGETLQEAAEREILEETGVIIKAKNPILTFDVVEPDENGRIRFHYVIVDLMADYVQGEPHPADDAEDVRWFSEADLAEVNINTKTRQLLKGLFKSQKIAIDGGG